MVERMRTSKFMSVLLLLSLIPVLGDQVELINGDRYKGNVLSLTASEIRLDNEINGLMKLPRNKVKAIFFGTNALPLSGFPMLKRQTNAPLSEDGFAKIKQGAIDPKALQQVQTDILDSAGPEAKTMFNDLLKGLMTGTLSAEDVRKQAEQTVNQVKSLQKEAGEGEDNPLLGSYLAILQRFIEEGRTNQPASSVPGTPRKAR